MIMKTKKVLSMILAAAMVAGVCGGCGSKPETTSGETQENASAGDTEAEDGGNKVQITFLNGFTGGDGEYIRKITDGFNESQDKYEILESQEKDHLTNFKANGADMVVIQGSELYTYMADGMIQEVSSIYENAGVSLDDYVDAAQDIVSLDDGIYAFPLDIHPLTMFYNKELVPEAPETYEDLVEINTKLQAENKDVYAMTVPGAGLSEWYYMMLAAQNGVEFEEDGACNFATDEFADTLMKWHDVIFTDKISPANMGLDAEFTSFAKTADDITVQAAVALTGPWYYNAALEVYGDNLGIAPVPLIGKEQTTYAGSHNIAVSSTVTDEEKLAGMAEFFKYLYTPENLVNWADAGQTPVHKATLELIEADPEKHPLPAVNAVQVANAKIAPQVYNVSGQMAYIGETIFGKVVSDEKLTKDDLMAELENATDIARQVADEE